MLGVILGISIPLAVVALHISLLFWMIKFRKRNGFSNFDGETLLGLSALYFFLGVIVGPIHLLSICLSEYQDRPLKVETPTIYQEAGYRDSAKA